jgi:hypothetical protein
MTPTPEQVASDAIRQEREAAYKAGWNDAMEECAKLAEELEATYTEIHGIDVKSGGRIESEKCFDASIRARKKP